MIKAIFWDNDGVLVDTERLYFRATQQVLASVGVILDLQTYREFYLARSAGTWHLAAQMGFSEAQIDRLRKKRNDLYSRLLRENDVAVEGTREVLQTLSGRFKMGVVTSSWRDHFEIMHSGTGFKQYFEFVLAREDYERSKPDAEPYSKAVEIAGCHPSECIAVEDSERGLTAAKAAGLACWVIPTELTDGADFSSADRILSRISDVVAHLAPELSVAM